MDAAGRSFSRSHRIEIAKMELLGGGREVPFKPGLNIVQGEITSGKTTFVRLIRSLFGTIPSGLPPETGYIRTVLGEVYLGDREWKIFRPLVTTNTAPVDVAEIQFDEDREPVAFRLPAAGRGQPYSTFLLDQLSIPAVSVPRARSKPSEALTPVTMTDWLGYCIITGEEIDTQVFGHMHQFRDIKRKSVFELAYGYYNPDAARMAADLRSLELQIDAIDRDSNAINSIISSTPFADARMLESQLQELIADLAEIQGRQNDFASEAVDVPGVRELQSSVISYRVRQAEVGEGARRIGAQLVDLRDLERQLKSQAARLTRAIVADEWLVDFDFVVCPRCGNDIDKIRTDPDHCYLCLQEPRQATSRDDLLTEQSRITEQIVETGSVIESRLKALRDLNDQARRIEIEGQEAARVLDNATSSFVSERAVELEFHAARQADLEANIRRLREYLEVHEKLRIRQEARASLEEQRDDLLSKISGLELDDSTPEENVKALEKRMLSYLRRLNIPEFDEGLTVKINRTTYLPIVSGRKFDELSSQGLKTLVNIAHSLAHHTVAIDRSLPMPGLLVLDGLIANAGYEGFDRARIGDIYKLLMEVGTEYGGALQIVAVDNDLPTSVLLTLSDRVILSVDRESRLVRVPVQELGRNDGEGSNSPENSEDG